MGVVVGAVGACMETVWERIPQMTLQNDYNEQGKFVMYCISSLKKQSSTCDYKIKVNKKQVKKK